MTHFVHKNKVMYAFLEIGMSSIFVGFGSGNTEKKSALFRREFSPARHMENVGRVVIIAKGWRVVDDDCWRRDGTAKTISLDACRVSVAKCGEFGQSRCLLSVGRSCPRGCLDKDASKKCVDEVVEAVKPQRL